MFLLEGTKMPKKTYFFLLTNMTFPNRGEGGSPTWEKFPHFPFFFCLRPFAFCWKNPFPSFLEVGTRFIFMISIIQNLQKHICSISNVWKFNIWALKVKFHISSVVSVKGMSDIGLGLRVTLSKAFSYFPILPIWSWGQLCKCESFKDGKHIMTKRALLPFWGKKKHSFRERLFGFIW